MAETETGAPKLGCTPWPYGRADDSAGADQTEDNLGSDGQTRDKWNIEEADQNTTHGSRNFQHRQRTESPGRAGFSQDDYHYTQSGNRQGSREGSDPQTRLNHNLRRRMKRPRYQLRLEDHEGKHYGVYRQLAPGKWGYHQSQDLFLQPLHKFLGLGRSSALGHL